MRRRSIGANEVKALRVKQEKTKLQMMVGHNPYDYRGSGLQSRGDKFLDETDRNRGDNDGHTMDCIFLYADNSYWLLSSKALCKR